MTTVRNAGTKMSVPTFGFTGLSGPPTTPAIPASAAPMPKTTMYGRVIFTPSRRTISASCVPARTMSPKSVNSMSA